MTFQRPPILPEAFRTLLHALRVAAVCALALVGTARAEPVPDAPRWGTDPNFPVHLTIGVQDTLPPAFRVEVLKPTVERLRATLPHARIETRFLPIEDLKREVTEGRIRAYFADPGFFADLQSEGRSEQLVALKPAGALDPTFANGIAVVVPKESEVRGLSDLKGRRVVSDSIENFNTWIIFEGLLHKNGLSSDVVRPLFTDYMAPSPLMRLAQGAADAAVLPVCELEWADRAGLLKKDDYRLLHEVRVRFLGCARSSRLYPGAILGAASSLDASAARSLTLSLLTAPPMPTGAAWAIVTDFSAVKNLYRELKRGPYEYLRRMGPMRFWETYRRELLASAGLLVALLILGLAYTVHVRALVRRRTADLERTMAEKDRAAEREQRLRERVGLMERAGVVSELSSMFAHEVRQPVGAITAFAGAMNLYAKERYPEDAMLTHTSVRLVEEAGRVSDIVERVRGYAKGETHPRKVMSALEVLHEALAAFRLSSVSAGLTVRTWCDEALDVEVEPLEMTIVLLNLMKNAAGAMKRTDESVLTVAVSGVSDAETGRGEVSFRITDRGPRLSDEAFARLVGSAGPKASTKSDGLGLGLMLVRTVVESHAGRLLWERPDEGNGLTAEVRLPRFGSAAQGRPHKEVSECLQL